MSGDTPDILVEIAAGRAERVRRDGAAQGLDLPVERVAPLVPFAVGEGAPRPTVASAGSGILIAEVKRRSPSRGDIADIPDPATLAGRYRKAGFRRVSVLTEEARFGGSLADLIAVKTAHPDLAVLRKDFLLSVEDVEVSWRAGADAVLLIATLLEAELLAIMYGRAVELGMDCLVELHSREDVDKVRSLRAPLVGINSRDLRRFKVEPLLPLEIRNLIDWPCYVIYESGISRADDALFVRGSGFSGFLVGEAVARSPELAGELLAAWADVDEARRRYGAWKRLYSRYCDGVPLVKICGITNRADAELAVDAGADLIGFVLAESPRRAGPGIIRECADLPVIKVAVVVLAAGEALPDDIAALLEEGALDFIQFHGDETADTVRSWPSYKALRLAHREDAAAMDETGSPAVLVDAFSPDAGGGTGKRLDPALVSAAAGRRRLWIAGGLNPDNVGAIVAEWKPGLVDVSSGVEAEKGLKDDEKLRKFVAAAKGIQARGARGQYGGGKVSDKGFFGEYGGRYVAEVLRRPLERLEEEFNRAMDDPDFLSDLAAFSRDYIGRPTPLLPAHNASAAIGGADIYVKLEGLANTGAHKINNAAGQALLAKRMGKKRIIAETGAGQHGVAVAAACARLGLECVVYMGEEDIRRQHPNVYWMELFDAELRPVSSGSRTLKDAVNAALRDWASSWEDTHYLLGSALGPSPFPDMVREFQSVIGRETKEQLGEVTPDAMVACVGGGSNAIGFFEPYLEDAHPILIGAEAGGRGPGMGNNAARMTGDGKVGVVQGYKSRFLTDPDGQVLSTHSISAGLDYAGIGPQLAYLGETGRIRFVSVRDDEALDALKFFAREEGLIFALESAHAGAVAIVMARDLGPGKTVVVNMSGRGDKDIFITAAAMDGAAWRTFLHDESIREDEI